ncbi:hypothetical protein LP420_05450 [Massilia sp. B-10]|nr:hypothetical protein LP420_05450 [Massilia sp. B-10]
MHIFTLGTPHHGTSLAQMGVGKNAAQMRRTDGDGETDGGSAWLRAGGGGNPAHALPDHLAVHPPR